MAADFLIDPNDYVGNTSLNSTPKLENLVIYAQLTAERKGRTVIQASSTGEITSVTSSGSGVKINFLGFDPITNEYTTRYTENTPILDSTSPNQYEGFGMRNISIETNSSQVPKVVIHFSDTRGLSLMFRGEDSPYAVLFSAPPPVFVLKVKGYYGKPVKYDLHLLKNDISFNSESGNFEIKTTFIGKQFAPLSDILVGYLHTIPFMENEKESNVDFTETPKSLFSLIQRYRSVYDFTSKFKANSELAQKNIEIQHKLQIAKDLRNGLLNVIDFSNIENENGAITQEVVDLKRIVLTDRSLSTTTNSLLLNKIAESFETRVNNYHTILFGKPIKLENADGEDLTDLKKKTYKIDDLLGKLDDENKSLQTEFDNNLAALKTEVEDVAIGQIGGKPTIGYVFDIICKDVERFMGKLAQTSIDAEIHHNLAENKNQFLGAMSNVEGKSNNNFDNTKIYSFPDFVKKGVIPVDNTDGQTQFRSEKAFLGSKEFKFQQWPEISFIENFVNGLLRLNQFNEITNNSLSENINGSATTDKGFIPAYPNNSSLNGSTSSEYFSLDVANKLNTVFNKFIISSDYAYDITTTNIIKLMKFLGEIEARNIAALTVNDNEINLLKSLAKKIVAATTKEDLLNIFKTQPEVNYQAIKNIIELSLSNTFSFNGTNFYSDRSLSNFKGVLDIQTSSSSSLVKTTESNNQPEKILASFITREKDGISFSINNNTEKSPVISGARTLLFEDRDGGSSFLKGNAYFNTNDVNDYFAYFYSDVKACEPVKIAFTGTSDPFIQLFLIASKPFRNKIADNLYDVSFSLTTKDFFDPSVQYKFNTPAIVEMPLMNALYMGGLIYYYDLLGNLNLPFLSINSAQQTQLQNYLINLATIDKTKLKNFFTNYANSSDFLYLYNEYLKLFRNYTTGVVLTDRGTIQKDLTNGSLLSTLRTKKVYLINGSYKTFSTINNNPSAVFTNLMSGSNYDNFYTYFRAFGAALGANLNEKQKLIKNETTKAVESLDNDNIKLQFYQSFKSLNDRWLSGDAIDIRTETDGNGNSYKAYFPGITKSSAVKKLIDSFVFVDRAFNDISNTCLLDLSPLLEFDNSGEISVYTMITKLLAHNNFLFFPLQSYIDFSKDDWQQSFKITLDVSDENTAVPRFVCMYVGGYSSNLKDKNSEFEDDSISFENNQTPTDFNSNKTRAFRVSFGKQNQSIFKSVELNTEEFKETIETFTYFDNLLKNNASNPTAQGQNLFNIYEQRSYTAGVTALGNFCIQPTQYFELSNIPMFSGAYLILNTKHTLKPNNAETSFTGVRVNRFPLPFVQEFASILRVNDSEDNTLNNDRFDFSNVPFKQAMTTLQMEI